MSDDYFCGVMTALAIIYQADQETLAEEIVQAVGASNLLRVAKYEQAPWLPNLKATARALIERRNVRRKAAKS